MIKEMQMKLNVFFRAFIFPIIFFISLTILIHSGLSAADYDVLIRGGRVLDGSGKEAIQADVAVKDGRIVNRALKPIWFRPYRHHCYPR